MDSKPGLSREAMDSVLYVSDPLIGEYANLWYALPTLMSDGHSYYFPAWVVDALSEGRKTFAVNPGSDSVKEGDA